MGRAMAELTFTYNVADADDAANAADTMYLGNLPPVTEDELRVLCTLRRHSAVRLTEVLCLIKYVTAMLFIIYILLYVALCVLSFLHPQHILTSRKV